MNTKTIIHINNDRNKKDIEYNMDVNQYIQRANMRIDNLLYFD